MVPDRDEWGDKGNSLRTRHRVLGHGQFHGQCRLAGLAEGCGQGLDQRRVPRVSVAPRLAVVVTAAPLSRTAGATSGKRVLAVSSFLCFGLITRRGPISPVP